jgi:hypothetical protein
VSTAATAPESVIGSAYASTARPSELVHRKRPRARRDLPGYGSSQATSAFAELAEATGANQASQRVGR